jgi:hypothetical protein
MKGFLVAAILDYMTLKLGHKGKGSQGHAKKFFLKGLIVDLNNQGVFYAQNHPEKCSKISPRTLKNAQKCSKMLQCPRWVVAQEAKG